MHVAFTNHKIDAWQTSFRRNSYEYVILTSLLEVVDGQLRIWFNAAISKLAPSMTYYISSRFIFSTLLLILSVIFLVFSVIYVMED